MNIRIICIGKLKESYLRQACEEYVKRLTKHCKLDIIELKEARLVENANFADEEKVKYEEGKAILSKISEKEYVIALEVLGEQITSVELSQKISKLGILGKADITFVIGGSLGLSADVSKRANLSLSFSKLTFTHQMIRILLLEQIYRAFKIARNENYHK
ncbi:MAG: 23S rRNA (pseudouridine(1915)-N(3))-methyltransferase RlmH [Eubacteriales bacterium]